MKRVVITGLGIVSSIGNSKKEVLNSLKSSSSGIKFNNIYKDLGLRSHVSGSIDIDLSSLIDRKKLRFMGEAAAYGFISAEEAIKDSNLAPEMISNPRTGLIMGSGGASSFDQIESADILREKGVKKIGPYRVTKAMGSTVSACLSTFLKIKGINYSISSACSTSLHCIGNSMEQIQLGKQDIMLAGGAEAEHWGMTSLFDAMGALSSNFNNTPSKASRPFDEDRDGFVIAGGGGALILEEMEHALKRKAKIYAEITGYAATSDGEDMVSPSGNGGFRSMKIAWEMSGKKTIDYINAHGTSTPVGDLVEMQAIKDLFGDQVPYISSTKALSGHSLGAAGVHESIFSLLMLENNFLVGSANADNINKDIIDMPILLSNKQMPNLQRILSNSFGFGGTNGSLIFEKYKL
jgi:3-oxoacyl-[acyl-carrier-protein] synthase-1